MADNLKLYRQQGRSDVWMFEKVIKGKRYKFCYAISKYGKHAKLMAEYSAKHLVKLNNWFEEKENYIIIWSYFNKENEYKQILIDKEDYDLVKDYYWGIRQNQAGNYYAQTNKGTGKNKNVIWMHRLINNTPDNLIVDHINRNGLDNRKSNLNNCDYFTNNTNFDKFSNNSTGFRGVYKDNENTFLVEWNDYNTHETKRKRIKISNYNNEQEALLEAVKLREKMTSEYAVNKYKNDKNVSQIK